MAVYTPITAVRDNSGLDLDSVKSLLGITGTDQDGAITQFLSTALEAADTYCNNPFTPFDLSTCTFTDGGIVTIPPRVKEGVVEYVRLRLVQIDAAKNATKPGASDAPVTPPGQIRVGQWSRSTQVIGQHTATGGIVTAKEALAVVQATYWSPYRIAPGY